MDPFSIVLGGIAICQVAAKVISLGIAYGQSVSNLPNEVQSLISEIALLAGVMNSLCSALQSEQANEELTISDILLETIKECRQQLEDLYQNLANQGAGNSRLRSLGRALKWPLKEQETKDWIARMERYKNTFSLALQKEGL